MLGSNISPGPPVFPTTLEPERPAGLLAGMRIRKKLIVLHTLFSLVLAGILALALWPAVNSVVDQAELHEAKLALSMILVREAEAAAQSSLPADNPPSPPADLSRALPPGVHVGRVPLDPQGRPRGLAGTGPFTPDENPSAARTITGQMAAVYIDRERSLGYVSTAMLAEARAEVNRLFILMTIALLGVYALIAISLEVFVLPRHVYEPISHLLRADRAVQDNQRADEFIPEAYMPADELGEIMRSRNRTVRALRTHESDLALALTRLEEAATDLRRKNHLLENAQRNLADADRLASLGIMSAGLAHEMNTPLAVVKGLVEKMSAHRDRGLGEEDAALLLRVVGRLERLSESLLDFARVRPPRLAGVAVATLVDEAWTLVSIDPEARRVELVNRVDTALTLELDADRMLQVLVNIIRNAVNAIESAPTSSALPASVGTNSRGGRIEVANAVVGRDGRDWAAITIADDGPGIAPEILARLFEPFASTRLDARGTGLGLAVSEGIVREHGGVLLARNRESPRGSIFEIVLPTPAA